MADQIAPDETTARIDVRSTDGVRLAVWEQGGGPPIVLVHGSPSDHATFGPLVERLRQDFTTFALDRRGSGASGDGADFSVEREFEDIAAVVDAVAARTGAQVVLFGHSYGAACSMGGAARTANLSHLVLYEPSFGLRYPAGAIEAVEAALAAGDSAAAIELVLRSVLEMSEDDVSGLRATPRWDALVAVAPRVPRKARVEAAWVYRAGQFDTVAAPTLVLTGSATTGALRETTQRAAAAVPGAVVRELVGHGHMAHRSDPDLVAAAIREFVAR